MNASALDNSAGNVKKITVKNEKGILDHDDIGRIVRDAEKFKDQNELIPKRVKVKNDFEEHCLSVRNSLNNEQFADAISQSDEDAVNKEIDYCFTWIESNFDAIPEAFEESNKNLKRKSYQSLASLSSCSGRMPGELIHQCL
jgi:L1 cell adhesion molecule like protein